MAKGILKNANFLLLDEPTNHLDIESKEVILHALGQYQGTILFVSHDQDFVNKLATKIVELTPQGVTVFEGNYDQYLETQEQLLKIKSDSQKKVTHIKKEALEKTSNKNNYELQKKSKNIENKIDKLEKDVACLLEKMGNYAYGSDMYQNINQQVQKINNELVTSHKEWENLQSQIESEN